LKRDGSQEGKQTKTIMTRNKSTLVAVVVAGASLLASSQVRAQSFTYSADDLVLNFRNTASVTANDLEVDLGSISSFTSFSGTETLVPASLITSVYGAPSASVPIGFSADAADASGTTGTLWLTRADTTPGIAPTTPSGQQVFSAQNLVAARIANIGAGASAGTILASQEATVPGSTSGNSYQAQGEQSAAAGASGQGTINFGGDENIAASKGGNIESIQTGSGPVYEALWEVPVTGTADTYLGYFTFNSSGSVQFTSVTSVPEPSTYALFGATGLVAIAFRRQLRSWGA
jgi:PEP-CTERM motif